MTAVSLSQNEIQSVVRQVQKNCDIANAHYALDDPLCIYLLKMRDLFRWQHCLACTSVVDKSALGQWVADQETRWLDMEESPYEAIVIGGHYYDCLDSEAVNLALEGTGLVYGAERGDLLHDLAPAAEGAYWHTAADDLAQRS